MYFNLPLLNPFLANGSDFTHGANFAVASGTALDAAALATKNISLRLLNVSLVSQLGWFQTHVHSICSSPSGTLYTTLYNTQMSDNIDLIHTIKYTHKMN